MQQSVKTGTLLEAHHTQMPQYVKTETILVAHYAQKPPSVKTGALLIAHYPWRKTKSSSCNLWDNSTSTTPCRNFCFPQQGIKKPLPIGGGFLDARFACLFIRNKLIKSLLNRFSTLTAISQGHNNTHLLLLYSWHKHVVWIVERRIWELILVVNTWSKINTIRIQCAFVKPCIVLIIM